MSTLCRAAQWQKYTGADLPAVADLYAIVAAATADAAQVGTSENPFFCQTHLSAFLKGGRPPVQFRRSQSQSVTVIKSLKRRDHPPSQHLPGMKPLKGRVKEGPKISDNPKNFGNISDKQPFSEIISDYFFWERDRPGRCAGRLAPHFRAKACLARRQTPHARRARSLVKLMLLVKMAAESM